MKESSSYPPYQKVMANLKAVKEHGISVRQAANKRIKLLERMLAHFGDGRSKAATAAATLLDPAALENELRAAARKIKAARIPPDDAKARARVLRALLDAAR